MNRRKILSALAAAALAAGMLAGCGSTVSASSAAAATSSSAATSSEAVSSEAVSSEAASSSESAASSTAAAYDSAAFKAILDKAVAYAADTAGGSLKNAQVADELVRFVSARTSADTAAMVTDATAWLAAQTQEKKDYLATNWEGIYNTAIAIAKDPASQKELLETAGVNSDYSDVVVTNAQSVLEALDGVLKAVGK